jgi:hypothetical protein
MRAIISRADAACFRMLAAMSLAVDIVLSSMLAAATKRWRRLKRQVIK